MTLELAALHGAHAEQAAVEREQRTKRVEREPLHRAIAEIVRASMKLQQERRQLTGVWRREA